MVDHVEWGRGLEAGRKRDWSGAQLGTVCGELRVRIVLAGGWSVNDVRVGDAVAAHLPVASV